jgi:hypothetical protein
MALTSFRFPASEGQIASEWTNPTNVFASDGNDATTRENAGEALQDYHNFGFSAEIPAGSTINSIVVRVEGALPHPGDEIDELTDLVKAGSIVGTQKTIGTFGSGADQTIDSSPADLWGTTWTAAEVNASTFGVHFQTVKITGGGGATLNCDAVQIQIDFTAPVVAVVQDPVIGGGGIVPFPR